MKDAIRHLDMRFKELRPFADRPRPPKGWIRAVRNALGLTTPQLAKRLGVAQSRIVELEKAEQAGNVTMRSLERAAEAMGCRVVYALVPDVLLAQMVETRTQQIIKQRLAKIMQTMDLENQKAEGVEAYKELAAQVRLELSRHPARLWDDKE